jgi:hypothetical protein
VAKSSGFRWALGLTAGIATVIGMASALWVTSFSASELKRIAGEPERSAAEPAAHAGPAPSPLGAAGFETNAERPSDPVDEGPALDQRAVAGQPSAIALPPVVLPAALPPAPDDVRKLGRPRSEARAASKARRKPDCTPPYTIDAAGRRHKKPQCF